MKTVPEPNSEQTLFLRELIKYPEGAVRPLAMALLCTDAQYRARQRSRRQGLVVFSAGRWCITDAGRKALGA